MNDPLAQAAILPFQITESLAVPCGYERSFKLAQNTILANRYLLGLNTADLSEQQLLDACHTLGMPPALVAQFQVGLDDANLVFLGFEADAEGGALFKVYLEYWEQLRKKLQQDPATTAPHLLHRGFKWTYNRPQHNLITDYQCRPGLSTADIRRQIQSCYEALAKPVCLDPVNQIIELAQTKTSGEKFIYVEVSEAANNRQSFDLNLYAAGLTIKEIAEPLSEAAAELHVDRRKFDYLLSLIQDKLFGHISAGSSRDGEEYLTIYYEN